MELIGKSQSDRLSIFDLNERMNNMEEKLEQPEQDNPTDITELNFEDEKESKDNKLTEIKLEYEPRNDINNLCCKSWSIDDIIICEILNGHIEHLESAVSRAGGLSNILTRFPDFFPKIEDAISKVGMIDFVKWLINESFINGWMTRPSEGFIHNLIIGDHADCLNYINECHDHVVVRDSYNDIRRAIESGSTKCLEFFFEQKSPELLLPPTFFSPCDYAASCANLKSLKFLHEHGCPLTSDTVSKTIENEALDCFIYLLENGCPYDSERVFGGFCPFLGDPRFRTLALQNFPSDINLKDEAKRFYNEILEERTGRTEVEDYFGKDLGNLIISMLKFNDIVGNLKEKETNQFFGMLRTQ
jgi:hypothetical protein